MTKKLVGHVGPEEQKEIKALFERRNGLTELAGIVTGKDSELYERVVTDLGKTWQQNINGKVRKMAAGR